MLVIKDSAILRSSVLKKLDKRYLRLASQSPDVVQLELKKIFMMGVVTLKHRRTDFHYKMNFNKKGDRQSSPKTKKISPRYQSKKEIEQIATARAL